MTIQKLVAHTFNEHLYVNLLDLGSEFMFFWIHMFNCVQSTPYQYLKMGK